MVTRRIHSGSTGSFQSLVAAGQAGGLRASWATRVLRLASLSGLAALGLCQAASAQTIGTMQVTARVVPARTSWMGLAEVGAAARGIGGERSGGVVVRRTGLVQTRTEIRRSGDRRFLLVTIQHPRN